MTEEERAEYHKKMEDEKIQQILDRARTAALSALMPLESDVFSIYWSTLDHNLNYTNNQCYLLNFEFKFKFEYILKHIISQNVDGLHLKTGIPTDKISELHGNSNLEICQQCGKKYMRDFQVREAKDYHDHKTSRKCDNPKCAGDLQDSIINFNESLNEKVMEIAFKMGE